MLFLVVACAGPPRVATVDSIGIPAADGVRLAADVMLPVAEGGTPAPTVLIQTRYWRSFDMRVPDRPGHAPQGPREGVADALAEAGYAVVIVDVRGTGASEGEWRAPFAPVEVEDARAVLDWIVAQPWSDGRVGAYGVSYEGSTALLAAATGHPALEAALAREVEWDLAGEILTPGGLPLRAFAEEWGAAVAELDRGRVPSLFPPEAKYVVRGVRPLDDDPDGALLAARVASRRVTDVAAAVAAVRGPTGAFGTSGWTVGELGPRAHAAALEATPTRLGLWGAWWDAATALGVLRAYGELGSTSLVDVRIGAWNHEGDAPMAPFGAGTTVPVGEVVAWFDVWLRGAGSTPRAEWFEAGRDQWHPLTGTSLVSRGYWLADGGRLSETPTRTAPEPVTVAPVVEGDRTRWSAGVLRAVQFTVPPGRGGVAWTSAALGADLRLAPGARLECGWSSEPAAAALVARLEAVGPDARTVGLTEAVVDAQAGRAEFLPVGVTVPAGWALRVRLTGGDPALFTLPHEGPARWTAAGPCQLGLNLLPS